MTNMRQNFVLFLSFAAALSSGATSVPLAETPPAPSVTELKARYLACEQLAARDFLDFSDAANCSMVAEALLVQGFGGSFTQLLQWWQSTRPCHAAACPDEPPAEVKQP